MDNQKIKFGHIITFGFTIFAIFFGAGNLIFPPYLGMQTGSAWFPAYIGFTLGDVVFGILGLLACLKHLEAPIGIYSRIGPRYELLQGVLFFMFTITLYCLPRTGAVAYEIGVQPILPGVPAIVWTVIFFGITWLVSIRPSKIVSLIGNVLSPLLILMIIYMVVRGVIEFPLDFRPDSLVPHPFTEGLMQGYNTMDISGGVLLCAIVVTAASKYGYEDNASKIKLVQRAAILGGIVLAIVYLGLALMGAMFSTKYGTDLNQTQLITEIVWNILGSSGIVALGIMTILACLSTAIGLVSASAAYYNRVTKGKLSYNVVASIECVLCAIVGAMGVSQMIAVCTPMIHSIIPVMVSCIFMTLGGRFIADDRVCRNTAYMAFAMGILDALPIDISWMPLASLGFQWVPPTAIVFVASLIYCKSRAKLNA